MKQACVLKSVPNRATIAVFCASGVIALAQPSPSKLVLEARTPGSDATPIATQAGRQTPQPSWVLKTNEAAITQAALTSGVDMTNATADLRVWSDDQTPCLAAQLNGKPAWVVRSTPTTIVTDPKTGAKTRSLVFNVALLAETGQLIRLWSDWPDGEPSVWPPCSATVAAERMSASGGEVWKGLASPKPRLSFVQVLQGDMSRRSGATIAKQFIAYAVTLDTSVGVSGKTIWSIEERGLPPQPIFGPPGARPIKAEPNATNHLRHIIFDDTGEWWSATTTPQPDPPPGYVDPSTKPASKPAETGKAPDGKTKEPQKK